MLTQPDRARDVSAWWQTDGTAAATGRAAREGVAVETADSMARDLVMADSLGLLRETALRSMSGTPGEVLPVRVEGLVAGGPTKTSVMVHLCEGSPAASAASVSSSREA